MAQQVRPNQAFGQLDTMQTLELLRALRLLGMGNENAQVPHPAGQNMQQQMANRMAAQQQDTGPTTTTQPGDTTQESPFFKSMVDKMASKMLQALGLQDAEERQRSLEEEVRSPEQGVRF